MVLDTRFELVTTSMSWRHSTAELIEQLWSGIISKRYLRASLNIGALENECLSPGRPRHSRYRVYQDTHSPHSALLLVLF